MLLDASLLLDAIALLEQVERFWFGSVLIESKLFSGFGWNLGLDFLLYKSK